MHTLSEMFPRIFSVVREYHEKGKNDGILVAELFRLSQTIVTLRNQVEALDGTPDEAFELVDE